MKILFCNEGFIIDGVASYNLYLSAALHEAGHDVAVIGRWGGFKGFQWRHRESGVEVIQRPAVSVDSSRLVRRAMDFAPDILFTDARRAFPLARKIRQKTSVKVVTVFHDPPQLDRHGSRSIESIGAGSDIWVTPERPIYEQLLPIAGDLPVRFIQRPLTGMVTPTGLPPAEPFQVLCLGRLSRWKSPGLRAIVERAPELKKAIPPLRITVVGGGRRRLSFWLAALKANARAGERFVRIVGTQTDPGPWIAEANLVCAGATAAIEAILSGRPVLAFSGFWLGPVTPQNIKKGVSTHFGERSGDFQIREDPDVVIEALIDLHRQWDQGEMRERVRKLQAELAQDFDSGTVSSAFQSVFDGI